MGEYDRRISLLTKEKGKVAAFARGARKPGPEGLVQQLHHLPLVIALPGTEVRHLGKIHAVAGADVVGPKFLKIVTSSPLEKLYTFKVAEAVLGQLQTVAGRYMKRFAGQQQFKSLEVLPTLSTVTAASLPLALLNWAASWVAMAWSSESRRSS